MWNQTPVVSLIWSKWSSLHFQSNLLMPRSHIHGSPRRFRYGSNPTDDPGNDNFRSPIRMHNASTTTYDYGCNTEIYGLIRIATDDAGSYPWLILRPISECVTWALQNVCLKPLRLKVKFYARIQNVLSGGQTLTTFFSFFFVCCFLEDPNATTIGPASEQYC